MTTSFRNRVYGTNATLPNLLSIKEERNSEAYSRKDVIKHLERINKFNIEDR